MSPKPIGKLAPQTSEEAPYPKPARAWYVLGLLTLVYVFSFLDRTILSLLVGPIRRDFHITDTQISLLIGFSFAVFYTFLGLPLGRIGDRYSRRQLIAIGISTWSLFCAGCGLAKNFGQMLFLRMGVGVGEASLSPAAYSLITDYFAPKRRAMAMSIYSMGIYIGGGLASVLGGLVAGWANGRPGWTLPLLGAVRSWQIVFFAVGLPGLPLALLMYTFAEPIRRGGRIGVKSVPLREVFGYVKTHRKTYLCHHLGIAFMALAAYGGVAWNPTFFIRHHHWSVSQAGVGLGIVAALGGPLGLFFGGWLADRLAAQGQRDAYLRVAMMAMVAAIPAGAAYLLVFNSHLALFLLAPVCFLTAIPIGTGPAALMQVTPSQMRGQISAVYLFTINLIGLGAGPTVVALMTDHVFRNDAMVGSSLLVVGIVSNAISALILWSGLKSYVRSQDQLKKWIAALPV
ncbi:MAG: MFS transporter [Acidobacteriaceae bacterium]|nr:MFS transporter [Acidobacteriaceae bacterium]